MKYVLLGQLERDWIERSQERLKSAKAKLGDLGITIEAVYYTQGEFDFVDVVEAADPLSILTFSVWYAKQGYGKIRTMPAFAEAEMDAALSKV